MRHTTHTLVVVGLIACSDAAAPDTGAAVVTHDAPVAALIPGPAFDRPIGVVQASCATGSHWTYEVWTNGVMDRVVVNASDVHNVPYWDEEYPLFRDAWDADRHLWSHHLKTLPEISTLEDWIWQENTLFQCDIHAIDGTMGFVVRAYDAAGLADCVIFGFDASGYRGGDYPAVNNGMTSPEQLGGCRLGGLGTEIPGGLRWP